MKSLNCRVQSHIAQREVPTNPPSDSLMTKTRLFAIQLELTTKATKVSIKVQASHKKLRELLIQYSQQHESSNRHRTTQALSDMETKAEVNQAVLEDLVPAQLKYTNMEFSENSL